MSNQYSLTPMAQGLVKPATAEEIEKEQTYTNPNLHRRVITDSYEQNNFDFVPIFAPNIYFRYNETSEEYEAVTEKPDTWETNYNDYFHKVEIAVGVFGIDSYRMIKSTHYHDEESTESEIP